MDRMQKAEAYRKELGKTGAPALAGTDPELAAIRERLEYGEIAGQGCLDARRRRLITLVALAAIQTPEGIGEETRAAPHQGVRPEEIRPCTSARPISASRGRRRPCAMRMPPWRPPVSPCPCLKAAR